MSLLPLCSVYCAAPDVTLVQRVLLPFTGDTERWAHGSLFTVASAGPPGAARGLANVAGARPAAGGRNKRRSRKRRIDVKMKIRNKYVMNGSGCYFCTNFIKSE